MDLNLLNNQFFDKIFQSFNIEEVQKQFIDYFKSIFFNQKIKFIGFLKFLKKKKKFILTFPGESDFQVDCKIKELLEKAYDEKEIINKEDYLVIPLVFLNKCIGIILIQFLENIKNIPVELNLIIKILSLIYYTVNIYNIAIKDSLTKVYNKRFFEYKIEELKENELENNLSFSIIIFDIDHFKHYNDKYGHLTGDMILKVVSKKVGEIVDKISDAFLARYGGEEFIIFLKDKGKAEAIEIAEKIRKTIENTKIETQEYFWRLTISVGVASYPEDGKIDEILNKADIALYVSKKKGRNRTTAYEKDFEPYTSN